MKSLLKDSFREIFRYPARFLSILAIVAIGTAFFAGVKGAAPNMKFTADKYYDDYNMMDIRVLSTLGLNDEDVQAISDVEGVESVRPAYTTDVATVARGVQFVFRVHSIPDSAAASPDASFINMPKLVEGRLPAAPGECVVEDNNNLDLGELGIHVGDQITVNSGTEKGLTGTLTNSTFTIVGTVVSPYYLTFDKDSSEIGTGKVDFFMMVTDSEFTLPVYTEALVRVAGAEELSSYSDQYSNLVSVVTDRLDDLGEVRAPLRLEQMRAEAIAALEAAKAKLAAEEAAFNNQVAAAQAQLDQAARDINASKARLAAGQAQLAREKQNYETSIANAEAEIAQSEKDLADAEAEYATEKAQYDQAKTAYSQAKAEIGPAKAQAEDDVAAASKQISSITAQLENPNLTDAERAELENDLASAQASYNEASQQLAIENQIYAEADAQFAEADNQLKSAQAQLTSARAELNAAKKDLANAKADGARKIAAAERELATAEAQIASAQQRYNSAAQQLASMKAAGSDRLEEAKRQLIQAQNEIDKMSAPSWYDLDRRSVYSYSDYNATANQMDAVANLFPIFFFTVAGLVCLTTMTRMVDEQRYAIGTYKASGYGNAATSFKYLNYAALASVIGGVIGVAIGIKLFPRIIFDSWSIMYNLPPMGEASQVPLLVATVVVAVVGITLTALAATRNALQSTPSMLMRPKAPKQGKPIALERVTSIWRRLTFSQKVTMRNLFRYKKRLFMTVVGIAGCSALLLAGLGIKDSIGTIVQRQYGEIFSFDLSVKFEPTNSQDVNEEVLASIRQDADVVSATKASILNATVDSGDDDLAASMIAPLEAEGLKDAVKLRDRRTQRAITLDDTGVVISEKLAKQLNVGVGDTINVDNSDGAFKPLTIAAITENYVFHFIYISPTYYEQNFGYHPLFNYTMVDLKPGSNMAEQLGTDLVATGKVADVRYFSSAANVLDQSIQSLNGIVWVMIFSSALLAFVVLYNLTNINLSERLREIATLKVLGFRNREVAGYVYRENMILTVLGGLFGLLVGVVLHRTIMASIEQEGVMFGDFVRIVSFFLAFLLTLGFGIFVNFVMYPKLNAIKMVESLKSVE